MIHVDPDDAVGAFVRVSTSHDAFQVVAFLVRPVRCKRRQCAHRRRRQLLVLHHPAFVA
jgi:hypothetical protein